MEVIQLGWRYGVLRARVIPCEKLDQDFINSVDYDEWMSTTQILDKNGTLLWSRSDTEIMSKGFGSLQIYIARKNGQPF